MKRAALGSAALLLLGGAIVFGAFHYLAVDFSGLLTPQGLRQMGDYFAEFLRPDLSAGQLKSIAIAARETLAMSAIGTLLAALCASLLALPAAGYFGRLPKQLARSLLNVLRALPELVWAALMVLAAGLGPNAGTLAIALHTSGVLGRLFAEALENAPAAPADAIRHAGGPRSVAFAYGILPILWPQWISYTLYRLENNIRMSSVLGFVGAGGLGQMLYIHLSLFQQSQAASVIFAMLALVLVVDGFSQWLRQRYLAH